MEAKTSSITRCCMKKCKSAYGFSWKYVDKLPTTNQKVYGASGKSVQQLDKNKNIINTFASIREAAKATDVMKNGISNCCNGKSITAGGYYWRFTNKKDRVSIKKKTARAGIEVIQIDPKTGKHIAEFKSAMDAARALKLKSSSSIRNCCRGFSSSGLAGGYKWEYKDKNK